MIQNISTQHDSRLKDRLSRRRAFAFFITLILYSACTTQSLHAAGVLFWKRSGEGGKWSNQYNWSDTEVPSFLSTVQFDEAYVNKHTSIDVDSAHSASSLYFYGNQNFTFNNGSIYLYSGFINAATHGNTGRPIHTFNSDLHIGGNSSMRVQHWVTVVINGDIHESRSSHYLNKFGAGTLKLYGQNTYTQYTDVHEGILAIEANANLGTDTASVKFTGGTLQIDPGVPFDFAPERHFIAETADVLIETKTGANATILGGISGTSGLYKDGYGVLNLGGVPATYEGPTTIQRGTLLVNNTSGSATGNGTVTVKPYATLGGHGSVAGAVNISSNGIIAPGDDVTQGELDTGPLTFNSYSRLNIDIGVSNDSLLVNGALNLSGQLNLQLDPLYTPNLFDTYRIATATSISGSFDSYTGHELANGLILVPQVEPTTVDMVTAIPADFDLDGKVAVSDLIVWAKNFGVTDATYQTGDADLNNTTSVSDLIIWAKNFGRSITDFPAQLVTTNFATAIPEPSTLLLLSCGVASLRRRKK